MKIFFVQYPLDTQNYPKFDTCLKNTLFATTPSSIITEQALTEIRCGV